MLIDPQKSRCQEKQAEPLTVEKSPLHSSSVGGQNTLFGTDAGT